MLHATWQSAVCCTNISVTTLGVKTLRKHDEVFKHQQVKTV